MTVAAAAIIAVLLDRLLGEPRRFHPLVGFGRLASDLEGRLNRGRKAGRLRGCLAVVLLTAPPVGLAAWLARSPGLSAIVEVMALYFALGLQSLGEHAEAVRTALAANDRIEARRRVACLVSRDTGDMSSDEVARATVESVLENGNDAVFGALFWFGVAGAPGVVLYRLANTLDAMWGYKSERFIHFGWAAARLDDVLNYLPARLTALTYASLGHFRVALRCWRTQAGRWESPNAGPVMTSGAGALGLRLGGAATYRGVRHERPGIGQGRPATAGDITRAMELVRFGTGLWLALCLAAEVVRRATATI
ncbi:adenosylcobinamide-phosphate synthase CbiB [Methylococcus sp. EFPC2]|uniref:adenosylcobinamide-phosphate synthase CbiB n=1 Tax=Methylococcus sp. EFPC2 TaxID=2812648 RepID=UPI0019683B84|nr:adenosylcobinamide-phosphate synthase CbiB [Methylococcus sp. EFPC2]QSA98749.1 cobalamin biosynthesis protein [Methylococcus sp. EFPC2]